MYPLCWCKNVPMYLRQRLNGLHRTWQPATSNPLPLCASLFPPQLSSSKATWVYLFFWPKTARGCPLMCQRRRLSDISEAVRGWGRGWQGRTFDPRGLSALALSLKCDRRERRETGESLDVRRGAARETRVQWNPAATGVREHSSRVRGKKTDGNWVTPFTGNARDRSNSQWIWLLFCTRYNANNH